MASVLIVSDEKDLLSIVESSLRAAGFETSVAMTGEKALIAVEQLVPEFAVLDLALPDISGTELCRRIKAEPRTKHLPVVMLAARRDEAHRVAAFEVGADDYLTKPFSTRELVLRVRAVLRRVSAPRASETVGEVGPIRVDMDAHRAFVNGVEIRLTALEFRLLSTFMARGGRVQSRQELLADVWEMSSELETRTVDTHVKRLRKKLGSARVLLETVRRVGYRLVAPGRG